MSEFTDLNVYSGTSAANTAQTVSTTVGKKQKVLKVIVKYSAAPTQTGVDITLDSALGAAFDAILLDGSEQSPSLANVQTTVWYPDILNDILDAGDQLDVLAPAGGMGITSTIAIYTETYKGPS